MLRFEKYAPYIGTDIHVSILLQRNIYMDSDGDFQLVLILLALTFPSLCYFYNLEPSKLEGCWSARPRCATAVSQLVVERQYCRSVSCNVIARVYCLVTGGVSGHYSVTCSSLVLPLIL